MGELQMPGSSKQKVAEVQTLYTNFLIEMEDTYSEEN